MKRYCLFDIINDLWIFEKDGQRVSGNDFSQFLDYITENIEKDTHIIVNDNFHNIIKKFQENNLVLNVDYKILLKRKNVIKGITYNLPKGKHIYFRNYESFFGEKLFDGLNGNLDIMEQNIQEFISLTKNRAFYKNYGLFEIVYDDFKKKTNWEENYRFKISENEFNYLRNWVGGAFHQLNPDYKNKIVKVSFAVDKNSFYQEIMQSKPMPYGAPIYDCDLETCKHDLCLLRLSISATLKDGYIPIITRKETTFDFKKPSDYLSILNNEIIYVTGEKFDLILEYYDIEDIEVLDYICFESKLGTAKEFNDKWLQIKNKTTNQYLKKEIKHIVNIFIGMQASKWNGTISRWIPTTLDDKMNFKTKQQDIKTEDKPYIPLYLFVTDFARNEMSNIAQEYKEYFISSNTDALTFKDLKIEDFKYEINNNKLGAFKLENRESYYYFKSISHYIGAKNLNEKGGINIYRHSGIKKCNTIDTKNKSFNEVVEILQQKQNQINEIK